MGPKADGQREMERERRRRGLVVLLSVVVVITVLALGKIRGNQPHAPAAWRAWWAKALATVVALVEGRQGLPRGEARGGPPALHSVIT